MDVIAGLAGVFAILMLSIYKGIDIFYPLFFGLILFMAIAYRRGFKPKELFGMVLKGIRKSTVIISILMLIGAITAVWKASGTVAYVVYHGIKLINPNFFILYAFILCSMVSFLLGTSFGTVGTIGMILMVMVRSGDINTNIVAGAIIAGAYFGDRCSPMSSSANLVATVTNTDLYINIRNMLKTSVIPFIACIGIYAVLSVYNPLQLGESSISTEIVNSFNLNWVVVLPALIILVLAVFKMEVKLSMLFSILSGAVIAVLYQKESIIDVLRFVVMGYRMEEQGFLSEIITGGGLVSMLSITMVILVSFALSGVFEGTSLLKSIDGWVSKLGRKAGIFAATVVTGIIASCYGCSQTLAIMLTYQLVRNMYETAGIDKYELALDIENTVILMSALVPWNIAGAVPAATLNAGSGYAVHAYYLYLLPLITLLSKKLKLQKLYRVV